MQLHIFFCFPLYPIHIVPMVFASPLSVSSNFEAISRILFGQLLHARIILSTIESTKEGKDMIPTSRSLVYRKQRTNTHEDARK